VGDAGPAVCSLSVGGAGAGRSAAAGAVACSGAASGGGAGAGAGKGASAWLGAGEAGTRGVAGACPCPRIGGAPAGAWPRAAVRRVGGGASPVRTDGVAGRGAPGAADLGATEGEKARGTSAPGRVLCAGCGVGPVAAGSPNGTRPRCATPTVSVVASAASSALAATEPPAREVAVSPAPEPQPAPEQAAEESE